MELEGTTKECARCGVEVEKSLWVRTHSCPSCGFEADRDRNAAFNAFSRGLEKLGVVHAFADGALSVEVDNVYELHLALRPSGRTKHLIFANTKYKMMIETTSKDAADAGDAIAHSLDRSQFAHSLLRDKRKARVYTAVLTEGPVTRDRVNEIINDVGETTIYQTLRELSESEYVTVDDSTEPYEYTATPVRAIVLDDRGEKTLFEVTPTFIAVVSASAVRDDLALFIERHSIGMLAAAFDATVDYLNGEMSRRMAAEELGLEPYEGIAITDEIESVITTMHGHDPYLDAALDEEDD